MLGRTLEQIELATRSRRKIMASYKSFLKKIDSCIPDLKGHPVLHGCKTKDELRKVLKVKSDEFGARWVQSNRTDFSFYQEQDYLLECIWCYLIASYLSMNQFDRFWTDNNLPKDASVIDVYNGLGFTTEYLYGMGFTNVSIFSDVKKQIDACTNLCKYSYGQAPTVYTTIPSKTFDVVISLETFEHFEDPFPFIKSVMGLSSKYIVETASYGSPNCYGHFETYYNDKVPKNSRQIKKEVHELFKKDFDLVFKGFNSHPSIWKRKE